MLRKITWIAVSVTWLLGGLAFAQGPMSPFPPGPPPYGYPPPNAYGYPPPNAYGYPGYGGMPGAAPMPYPSNNNMSFGNANPGGIPQPHSPDGRTPTAPGTGPMFPPGPMPVRPMPWVAPPPGIHPGGPWLAPPPGPGGMPPFPPMPRVLPNPNAPQLAPTLPPVPRERPGEPYLVPPEPPARVAPPPVAPPSVPAAPEVYGEVGVMPVGYYAPPLPPPPPPEPYVLYEGRRFEAEVREDYTHTWVQASYLHWFLRRDTIPPLVSTGALDTPGTVVLSPGSIAPQEFSGIRVAAGMWCNPEHNLGLEAGGFWLGRNHRQLPFRSDANGSPLLVQPLIFAGDESGVAFAAPGVLAGRLTVTSAVDFHGAELNLLNNLLRWNGWAVDFLGGVRYQALSESLIFDEVYTTLPGAGATPFNGVNQPPGSTFQLRDSFQAHNRFYGGQVGGRVNWTCCCFDLGAVVKAGVGVTNHTVTIDGSSTLVTPGGAISSLPGSLYALPSNSGRFSSSDTSFVGELQTTVGYSFAPCLRIMVGYSLLGWTRVIRTADQLDRNVDINQIPTFSPGATAATGTAPLFPATRTMFWAQGIDLGVEVRY